MRRKAATLARVEGSARQSLAERSIHCTCVWDLRQVPNRGAVPIVRLMETNLPRKSGNGTAVVVNPAYKIGHKRKDLSSLTTRILIRKPPGA
jgi:hypothetical protein